MIPIYSSGDNGHQVEISDNQKTVTSLTPLLQFSPIKDSPNVNEFTLPDGLV